MESLHDLADHIGYEAIDREFMVWLDSDKVLREEAVEVIRQHEPDLFTDHLMHSLVAEAQDLKQRIHQIAHPNGPYGWEFCGDSLCRL